MKLEDDNRHSFYKVPAGYFEALPSKIQEKIEKPTMHSFGIQNISVKIAFVCLVFISLTYFLLPFSNEKEPVEKVELLQNFSSEELLNYISQTEINTSELIEVAVNKNNINDILVSPSIAEEYQLQETLLEDMLWNRIDE